MMGSRLASGSPSTSVGENIMDSLTEFLQQMARTIELLCSSYDTAAQTLQLSAFDNPDVRTSLSIRRSSVSPSTLQPTDGDEGKVGQVQNWFSQGLNFEEERRLNAAIFETQAMIYGRTLDPESQGNTFEKENRDALRTFLEDMKKTIQAWSVRHSSLVQAKNISTSVGADMDAAEATTTAEAACPPPQVLVHSDVAVMGAPALGTDEVSLTSSKDQDVGVIEVMDLPNLGEDEACEMPQSNHVSEHYDKKGDGTCFAQPEEGKEGDNSLPEAVQGTTDAASFSLQHVRKEIGGSLCAHQSPLQEVADKQEPLKELKTAFRSSLPVLQVDPVQSQSHGDMDVEITTTNNIRDDTSAIAKVDNAVTPKVEQAELNIRSPQRDSKSPLLEVAYPTNNHDAGHAVMVQPSQSRVDVVESPDWLPNGWVTEVKTRGSGHSAGTKDKYYFDPVSNRRFRSKTEVFCFLETGKRGRRKKRKIPPGKKLLAVGHSSAVQTGDLCQARIANGSETSGMASSLMVQRSTLSTSGPSNAPSVTAPMALFSNVYMPYRPGQPPEWQIYESLARFPFPVFDAFRYAEYNVSKSAYSRGAESSWRPFADKDELGKSVEKSKDGRSESLPKKRPRKSSKKCST